MMNVLLASVKKISQNKFYGRPQRCAVVLSVSLALAACATYDDNRYAGNEAARGAANANFASDSTLGAQLRRGDREALASSFTVLMQTGEIGATRDWRGNDAEGQITAGPYFISNLLADPDAMMPTRAGLDLGRRLETEQGAHVLAKNSNIRTGPSTDYNIAETLPSGTGVEGLGRVEGESWMLIAVDGVARGYVYEPLLVKAPGTSALELAGGPLRQPWLCREFTQSLNLKGQYDRWRGMACDYGDGWELSDRGGPTLLGGL